MFQLSVQEHSEKICDSLWLQAELDQIVNIRNIEVFVFWKLMNTKYWIVLFGLNYSNVQYQKVAPNFICEICKYSNIIQKSQMDQIQIVIWSQLIEYRIIKIIRPNSDCKCVRCHEPIMWASWHPSLGTCNVMSFLSYCFSYVRISFQCL